MAHTMVFNFLLSEVWAPPHTLMTLTWLDLAAPVAHAIAPRPPKRRRSAPSRRDFSVRVSTRFRTVWFEPTWNLPMWFSHAGQFFLHF